MAYEKFITRNGKTYGPYVYHSKRVNGKVISEYHGPNSKKIPGRKYLVFGGLIFLILLSVFVFLFSSQFTGKSILNLETYKEGGLLSTNLKLSLNSGELIPANSTITIEANNNTYTYQLNEVLKTNSVQGNFFLNEKELSGSGEGYGFIGKKETFPTVFFQLRISPKEVSSGGEVEENISKINETIPENITEITNTTLTENPTPENSTEIPETPIENFTETSTTIESTQETPITTETSTETTTEETPKETTEESSQTTESTQETPITTETSTETTTEETPTETTEAAPITGNFISRIFGGVSNFFRGMITGRVVEPIVVQGDLTKINPFTYDLPENSDVELVEGSVREEEQELNESILNLKVIDNTVEVTTNYSIVEEGFGSEYLTNESHEIIINLNDLGLNLSEGPIDVKISYLGSDLVKFSGNINDTNLTLNETRNLTVEEVVEELFNETINISYVENISLSAEEKAILKTMFDFVVVNTTAYDYRDKVIVDFKIANYSISQAYDSALSKEQLNNSIERDRIIWLKDLTREFNKKNSELKEKSELNSLYPVM